MASKNQADVLQNLLTTSFRGVVFDAERVEMEVGHATVVHAYPDRDGGRVESLGREPTIHTFRIAFLRSIDKDLYPNRWRAFQAAFLDGSTGSLVHPELGGLQVKPFGTFKTPWEAGTRAGVIIECSFIESDEDGEAFARALKQKAPYFLVEANAAKAKGVLLGLPGGPSSSLFDKLDDALLALKKVTGAIDLARLSVSNILASLARVVTVCNDLMLAVEKTWDPDAYEGLTALRDVVKGASDQVREVLGKRITVMVIPRDMPVEAAAAFVGAALDEFLQFNAGLAGSARVDAGTQVFVGTA